MTASSLACCTCTWTHVRLREALLHGLPWLTAQKVLLRIMLVLLGISFLLCFSAMAYLLVLGESFTDALQVGARRLHCVKMGQGRLALCCLRYVAEVQLCTVTAACCSNQGQTVLDIEAHLPGASTCAVHCGAAGGFYSYR